MCLVVIITSFVGSGKKLEGITQGITNKHQHHISYFDIFVATQMLTSDLQSQRLYFTCQIPRCNQTLSRYQNVNLVVIDIFRN